MQQTTATTITNKTVLADIHTHILPQMDDGANTAEESVKLLVELERQGVTDVVFTPHFDLTKESVEEFCRRREHSYNHLTERIAKSGIVFNLRFHLGAEVRYDPNLATTDITDLCIGDTDYLLLELTNTFPFNFENTINSIFSNGKVPVLAHIERYSYLYSNLKLLGGLIDDGVVMQCNPAAFLSFKSSLTFKRLLKNGYVHILASDTHGLNTRPPRLKEALVKLKNHKEYLAKNSEKIITNSIV